MSTASRSYINVISAITVSGFCAEQLRELYRDRPHNKTILALCDQTWSRVNVARDLWERCDYQDLKKLEERLKYFERTLLRPKLPIPEMTSICLGLLDEVLSYLKDRRKRQAIERLMASISAIHRYYDRRGDLDDYYVNAGQVIDSWQQSLAV